MEAETDLSDIFEESEPFFDAATNFSGDDLFTVLQSWENCAFDCNPVAKTLEDDGFEFQKSSSSTVLQDQSDYQSLRKRMKVSNSLSSSSSSAAAVGERMSHITVERNRRKQMNEHLAVLRSLMPCFYVKRGDQASIIGGVVDYIHELQQILHSLEAKKQRKVLSPRPAPSSLSPRKPPLSPRLSVPISPRTPQPSSPYKPWMQHLNSPTAVEMQASPVNSSVNSDAVVNELVATSKSAVAEVEVKFAGANLVVKTVSHRIRGQAVRIVSALEDLAMEILSVKISTVDQTMLYFFTIKIGIDCQLSAEELAHLIHHTFC